MNRNLRLSTVRLICLGGFYLLLLVLFVTAAPAQTPQNPALKPAVEQLQVLSERLQLTEEQRTAVQPIMFEYMQVTRAVMEKHGIDPQSGKRPPLSALRAARGDLKKNREKLDSSMAAVLSPQQMQTFRQFQDEQRKAARARLRQGS
ncbi:MAG: LTXXQ motif family protein [Pseudomonadota bacterium]